MDKKKRKAIVARSRYEDQILELIDHVDEHTRSDLQGVVMAIVMKIARDEQVRD